MMKMRQSYRIVDFAVFGGWRFEGIPRNFVAVSYDKPEIKHLARSSCARFGRRGGGRLFARPARA